MAAFFLLAVELHAQEPLRIQAELGGAISNISARNSTTTFSSRLLPNVGITAVVPIAHGISLKTGAIYQQKGWLGHSSYYNDSAKLRMDYESIVNFHLLTLPLQLYYGIGSGNRLKGYVAGGISYGIVLSGKQDDDIAVYRNGQYDRQLEDTKKPYIGFVAKDSILKATYNGTMYYRFSPSVRVDAGLIWRDRYSVQVFWEQSINSISITDGTAASLTLGYYGMSVGIALNRGKKRSNAPS